MVKKVRHFCIPIIARGADLCDVLSSGVTC